MSKRPLILGAAALAIGATPALASNVDLISAYREVYASWTPLEEQITSTDTGTFDEFILLGPVTAEQHSVIQENLFGVGVHRPTRVEFLMFDPRDKEGYSILEVEFEVLAEQEFLWSASLSAFGDPTVAARGWFRLTQQGVSFPIIDLEVDNDFTSPAPEGAMDGGLRFLQPGTYTLDMGVAGVGGNGLLVADLEAYFLEWPAPGPVSLLAIAGLAASRRRR